MHNVELSAWIPFGVRLELRWRTFDCLNGFHNLEYQISQHYRMKNVARTPLLADLERAFDLLQQVDESRLDFNPDPTVSPDIRELTGSETYPIDSHQANLQARIEAVVKAGDKLESRAPSDYVSKLIIACVKLAPPSDD